MIVATGYRYLITLRRSPMDTFSMFVRPVVSAGLYAVFALFYLGGDGGLSFMLISLAILNIADNTVTGAAYEGRNDCSDDRLETIMMAPGGFRAFVWAQSLASFVVAAMESMLVLLIAIPYMRMTSVTDLATMLLGIICLVICAIAGGALGAWIVIRYRRFVLVSFASTILLTLGGAFYSVELLPQPFRAIAYANPVTYMIDVIRAPVLDTSMLAPPWIEVLIAAGFALLMAGSALLVTSRRVDMAKIIRGS